MKQVTLTITVTVTNTVTLIQKSEMLFKYNVNFVEAVIMFFRIV